MTDTLPKPTLVVAHDAAPNDASIDAFRRLLAFAERVADGEGELMPAGGAVIADRWTIGDEHLVLSEKGTGSLDDDSARLVLANANFETIAEAKLENLVMLGRGSMDARKRERAAMIARDAMTILDALRDRSLITEDDARSAAQAMAMTVRESYDAEPNGAMSYNRIGNGNALSIVVPGTTWRPGAIGIGGRRADHDRIPTIPHMVGIGLIEGAVQHGIDGGTRESPRLTAWPWDAAFDLGTVDAMARMRAERLLTDLRTMVEEHRP